MASNLASFQNLSNPLFFRILFSYYVNFTKFLPSAALTHPFHLKFTNKLISAASTRLLPQSYLATVNATVKDIGTITATVTLLLGGAVITSEGS